jgi:hypothetical protein
LYVSHYALRDYTVYLDFNWDHSGVFVGDKGGQGWFYSLYAKDLITYGKAMRSPWSIYDGFIDKKRSSLVQHPGIPIAKFNPGHIALWEFSIQAIALGMDTKVPPFSGPVFSYYRMNCHIWAGLAGTQASIISLLPIPKPNFNFF